MEYLYPCFKELFKIVKDYDKKLLELKKEKNSYTSVSYTHLDVYKRQELC